MHIVFDKIPGEPVRHTPTATCPNTVLKSLKMYNAEVFRPFPRVVSIRKAIITSPLNSITLWSKHEHLIKIHATTADKQATLNAFLYSFKCLSRKQHFQYYIRKNFVIEMQGSADNSNHFDIQIFIF